jgi:hypothetical protein
VLVALALELVEKSTLHLNPLALGTSIQKSRESPEFRWGIDLPYQVYFLALVPCILTLLQLQLIYCQK